jgi:CRISPR-associated protein Cas6
MEKMLAQIKMEIEGEGLNINMGSLFHGYIMKNIDPAFAEYFHYNTTNPFTSCVYWDREKQKYYWRITTFNKKAYDMIVSYFIENTIESIYLEHKELEIFIKSFSLYKTSFEEIYLNNENRNKIDFLTPTAFKSNGIIQIFPNISTLLMGVINKINQHSDTVKLEDEKIINELLENVYIDEYNLRTRYFYMEQIRVKGFIGNMILKLKNKDPMLTQLLNFLLLSSEYTGLGIKTALGMGGIRVGE